MESTNMSRATSSARTRRRRRLRPVSTWVASALLALFPGTAGGSDDGAVFRDLFYRNENGGFVESSAASGADFSDANSRGLALLDFDRDGDLDMVVSTFHSHPRLLRNDAAPPENGYLVLELEGDPSRGTNLDAIGAQVVARAEGLYVWRAVTGGEGYLSMSTLPVELGLGKATAVELVVLWPGGQEERFTGVAADQRLRVVQGRGELQPTN